MEIYTLLRSTSLVNKLIKKIDVVSNVGSKGQLEEISTGERNLIFIVDPMLFWYDTAIKTLEANQTPYIIYNGDLDEIQENIDKLSQNIVISDLADSLRFRIENPLTELSWRRELAGIEDEEELQVPNYGAAVELGDNEEE
ncbi:hypothetical protein EJP82_26100, partial [Paenibacillus anaericanus]